MKTFDTDFEYDRMFVFDLCTTQVKTLPLLYFNLKQLHSFMLAQRSIQNLELKHEYLDITESAVIQPRELDTATSKDIQYRISSERAKLFKEMKREDMLTINFISNILEAVEEFVKQSPSIDPHLFDDISKDLFKAQLADKLHDVEPYSCFKYEPKELLSLCNLQTKNLMLQAIELPATLPSNQQLPLVL